MELKKGGPIYIVEKGSAAIADNWTSSIKLFFCFSFGYLSSTLSYTYKYVLFVFIGSSRCDARWLKKDEQKSSRNLEEDCCCCCCCNTPQQLLLCVCWLLLTWLCGSTCTRCICFFFSLQVTHIQNTQFIIMICYTHWIIEFAHKQIIITCGFENNKNHK